MQRDEFKAQIKAKHVIMKDNKEKMKAVRVEIEKSKIKVNEYLTQVKEGKIVYTDEQLAIISRYAQTLKIDIEEVKASTISINESQKAVQGELDAMKKDPKLVNGALVNLDKVIEKQIIRLQLLQKVRVDFDALLDVLGQGRAPVAEIPIGEVRAPIDEQSPTSEPQEPNITVDNSVQ